MPKFHLSPNLIEVILPVIDYETKELVDNREEDVLTLLKVAPTTRVEIQSRFALSPSTTKRLLTSLLEQGKIERFGSGKATKYRVL
jgi:predicted HTH transcriptional regulator